MPSAPVKTLLLGGSFNPAHGGHRAITLAALKALGADEAWWLVSPGNPLKPKAGMAPLAARLASAQAMARRSRIRATAIEAALGTRYTVETLARLARRYPRRRFVWLMGADNLGQFHLWRDWRRIARMMPIAVVARPGYERHARRSVAAGWLRGAVHPPATARRWTEWSLPALVVLRFLDDPRSATAIRRANPNWYAAMAERPVRDPLMRRLVRSS